MPQRVVIIDGYNFIGSTGTLRLPRLASDRDRLVRRARWYAAVRGHRVICVFDGADHDFGHAPPPARGGVIEVYSPPGVKADPYIVAEVRRHNGNCVVVTDDRALTRSCNRAGAVVVDCAFFDDRLLRTEKRPATTPIMTAPAAPLLHPPTPPEQTPSPEPRPPANDEDAWATFVKALQGPPTAAPSVADPLDQDLLARMLEVPDEVAVARARAVDDEADQVRAMNRRQAVLEDL